MKLVLNILIFMYQKHLNDYKYKQNTLFFSLNIIFLYIFFVNNLNQFNFNKNNTTKYFIKELLILLA